MIMEKSNFNGVNNNYIPAPAPLADLPEMDCFTVEETEDGPVVVRKKREASVDLGEVDSYSLRSMFHNGVDPASLKINTRSVSRLDSMNELDKFVEAVDDLSLRQEGFTDLPDKTE